MKSRYFESNTEEERILIFQEYFDRDLESFFSSTIACCDECHDDFNARWPGTVSHDIELQRGYTTVDEFLRTSRIQDTFYPEEIERFSKFLRCPNCDAVLDGEFWIYEHPFSVREFSTALNEIAALASRAPFLLLTHPFAHEVLDVIVGLGKVALPQHVTGSQFRARRANGLPNPALADFGAPPAHAVSEGRYNHAGHPMIYLAAAERTAFVEIAAPGVSFHVAEMIWNGPMKILDLQLKPEAETRAEELIQCLARSSLCSAPRAGEGWVKREYVFTRFVADCALHAGFDAISYSSTKDRDGSNLVVLAPTDDIATVASLVGIRTLP
ncbi:RES family NAD+ phosphorylase [Mesorhizobium abyssinicae]|uniref:RES family NAD+ phosphorylase n=1 Tax=Mesorhizobium abyssinicae TaxID=1209958 RepID=UPI00339899D6